MIREIPFSIMFQYDGLTEAVACFQRTRQTWWHTHQNMIDRLGSTSRHTGQRTIGRRAIMRQRIDQPSCCPQLLIQPAMAGHIEITRYDDKRIVR